MMPVKPIIVCLAVGWAVVFIIALILFKANK